MLVPPRVRPSLLRRQRGQQPWWCQLLLPSELCPACPGLTTSRPRLPPGWGARRRRGSMRDQPRLFPPSLKSRPVTPAGPVKNPSWSLDPTSPQCSLRMWRSQSLPSSQWSHRKPAVTQRKLQSMSPGDLKYFYPTQKCMKYFQRAAHNVLQTEVQDATLPGSELPLPRGHWLYEVWNWRVKLSYIIRLQRWYLKWKGHFTVLVFVRLLLQHIIIFYLFISYNKCSDQYPTFQNYNSFQ